VGYQVALFLLIPHIVSYGLIPRVLDLDIFELAYISTYSYPILFSLFIIAFVSKKFVFWFQRLHKVVKDQQFLVQRRLVNLE
jgi:hypothetical protein